MAIENFESRLKIMENALAEVQNSVDVGMANLFNEIKANPKKMARKASKVALNSFKGLMELFPSENNRLIAWWRLMKVKLLKWGIPTGLVFAGYLLQLVLAG